ncbi:OLC1v1033575C1 [Oldenlandia corymbosa var. corymbosa]|uniref:OLC1v1033575C1 n=1 Tax=Oldenlandia corymbosa var. corymbosa TaxID=529605 RepID=A0AAV1CRG7_OLDCO|nr:OLC1v1033575C1 [Oldenlandia corymbosa var. corymbosa]
MKHMKGEEEVMTSQNKKNKAVVDGLYRAISRGDTGAAAGYLASDLEWWFHGPQNCHHMMKMLTGQASGGGASFRFNPRSVDAIDDELVIVEGWEGVHAYWVHVWKVNQDGLITQFREYFNTWLTVADLRKRPSIPLKMAAAGCSSATSSTLWQSHPRDLAKRSLPGLMLAI